MSESESQSSYCESNALYAQTPQEEEFLKIYDRLVSKRNPEKIKRDAFYLSGMTDADIRQRLTPLTSLLPTDKPSRVEQLTTSIYSLTLSGLWKYFASTIFVMIALLFCCQWHNADHIPAGNCVAFDVAVTFAILYGGVRAGWLSVILSAIAMRIWLYPLGSWYLFENNFDFDRFSWSMVALLLPMVIVSKMEEKANKANQKAPSNLGAIYY